MKSIRRTMGPLLLLLVTPPLVSIIWYTHVELGGSLARFWSMVLELGLFGALHEVWRPIGVGSAEAWSMIGIFSAIQLLLLRILPGRIVEGPPTQSGHVPRYRANGLFAYLITLALFMGGSFGLELFPATILYDHFGELIGAANVLALALCMLLFVKGFVRPSTPDAGSHGNPILDFFWGVELYPRILGWDVKQFTNVRFGMMVWPIILLSFAAKQYELHGLVTDAMMVSVGLQLLKTTKFFSWEAGYLQSIDIMHDRAGFYLCWGCLVWLPVVYPSASLYLVGHPHELGPWLALLIFGVGLGAHVVNYAADVQRQRVRATDGRCRVWGRKPQVIEAHYVTREGEQRRSLLLASGYWGIARHFHYLPELVLAFCWCVPALFDHALPYFYVLFLTILLVQRTYRDDRKCAEKYGKDWQTYCERVPYKMIPGII